MAGEAWWTADDVARHLRVSRMTVYRWTKSGRLPAYRIGRLRRYRPEDAERLGRHPQLLEARRPLSLEAVAAMRVAREALERELGPGVLTEDSVDIKRRMNREQEAELGRGAH